MTAEEILKETIGGFDPFIHSSFIKAMKIYANAKLDEAAARATTKAIPDLVGYLKIVDRDSILQLKDQI